MSGLIYKDLVNMRKNIKFLALYLILMVVVFSMSSPNSLGGVITAIAMVISLSTFTYDEQSRWNRYAFSLPVTRRQMVAARYLLVLIIEFAGLLLGALPCFFYRLRWPKYDALSGALAVLASFLLVTIVISLLLPVHYRFGAQKGRLILIVLFAVFILGGLAMQRFCNFDLAASLSGVSDATMLLALAAAAVVLFTGSFFLSVHFLMDEAA